MPHTLTDGPESGLKLLALDIETAPNTALVWELINNYISIEQLMDSKRMICWAAKWIGLPGVEFRSEYHDGQETMIRRMWDLLSQADAVVHYNGIKFDIPHINREIARLEPDPGPPAPYRQIDLMLTVKKTFAFPSYKLAYVAPALGLEYKEDNDGMILWVKCTQDGIDPEVKAQAWEDMKRYNIQDARLVEMLYDRIRAWIPRHPSVAAMTGDDCCPVCGGTDRVRHGVAALNSGRYPRYQCKTLKADGTPCNKWYRGTKSIDRAPVIEVAL